MNIFHLPASFNLLGYTESGGGGGDNNQIPEIEPEPPLPVVEPDAYLELLPGETPLGSTQEKEDNGEASYQTIEENLIPEGTVAKENPKIAAPNHSKKTVTISLLAAMCFIVICKKWVGKAS